MSPLSPPVFSNASSKYEQKAVEVQNFNAQPPFIQTHLTMTDTQRVDQANRDGADRDR